MKSPIAIFLRSLLMGVVLLALWSWFVPRAIGFRLRPDFAFEQLRTIAGMVVAAAGFVLWLGCLVYFAFAGRGTLVPIDAPKHLVVGGPYRYVRNPMYLGVAILLFGEAVAFAVMDLDVLYYFGSLAIVTVLFVRFYEEPTLSRLFGSEYDDYRAHVRRWLPSLHPWTPERQQSASSQQ